MPAVPDKTPCCFSAALVAALVEEARLPQRPLDKTHGVAPSCLVKAKVEP
jgi:hypothetical protein